MRAFIFCNQPSVEGKDTKPVHLARFFRTSCLYRRKRMRIVWFSASTLVELADPMLVDCGSSIGLLNQRSGLG